VSSFAGEASLIVAAFQLLAVRAVTGADRAADLESGGVATPSGIVEKPEPAPQLDVDSYQSNATVRTEDVLVKQPCYTRNLPPNLSLRNPPKHNAYTPRITPACDIASEPTPVTSNPIEPPWKVLPWMDRPATRFVFVREIKLVPTGSDISYRGKMIDVVM
jgi:hypothetical protein